ncbi:MAG: NADPH:quinone oxidoreductase family protein [Acidimicrobiales bacterium]
MRAVLCRKFGGPEVVELTEVEEPQAREGQVLVDVRACAINFPDLLMLQDRYQFKPGLPFIPGGEVAGVVRSLGEGVEGLAIGDRVIASAGTGGLAERVAVNTSSVVPVPEGLDLNEAAGALYAYGTSHHALRDRAALQPGETLLVLGAAGGVGLAAVELGGLMGARVIAAASSDEKLALCQRYGADETINYSHEDLKTRVRELTNGVGADVVYDPVGGPYAEPALRSTAWNGRFLVIGFAAGEIPRVPLNLPLLRGCSVVGVFWGSFVQREPERHGRNVAELAQWWRSGELKPHVSGTYPLERASEALLELAERRVVGKVVVTVP